jgi:hypothetical protein
MSIVSILVFLAISSRQLPRHPPEQALGLTANQVYSLSDQTIKILKELKEPVKVTVFERNDRQDVHKIGCRSISIRRPS